jgi:hypothetical protein
LHAIVKSIREKVLLTCLIAIACKAV